MMSKRNSRVDVTYTQNFLRSTRLVQRIVRLAAIEPGSTVLEIGPGRGIITRELVRAVGVDGRVVAVEIDGGLVKELEGVFSAETQTKIIHDDIINYSLEQLGHDYYLFANPPFSITTDLLTHVLNPTNGPKQAHLILQRDALIGINKAGYQTETLKSLMLLPFYEIEIAYTFERSDFNPKPGVDTLLFAFKRRETPMVDARHRDLYQDFVAYASKDRVGEGVWARLFKKPRLKAMARSSGLVMGRGIRTQSAESLARVFYEFVLPDERVRREIAGSMKLLKREQEKVARGNLRGGHHRSVGRQKN